MGVANAECYIPIERHIDSFYVCDKDFVICFNTPLLFFFNYDHRINRMGIANAECYIERDHGQLGESYVNVKAASHDSQMLVTATYSQQMTSSFDQLN